MTRRLVMHQAFNIQRDLLALLGSAAWPEAKPSL